MQSSFITQYQRWYQWMGYSETPPLESQLIKRLAQFQLKPDLFGVLFLIAERGLIEEGIACDTAIKQLAYTIAVIVAKSEFKMQLPATKMRSPKVIFHYAFLSGMIAERMINVHQHAQTRAKQTTGIA